MPLRMVLLLFFALLGPAAPAGAQTARGIGISEPEASSALTLGKQYLVVIAISRYQQWDPLAAPVKDAREIKDILVSRYRFDRVSELYDEQATKANIIRLLARLQEKLESDDSLLILYAGHGHLDKKSNTGFWIPVDAGTEEYEQQNWLPHTQLRGLLANMAATHLFVISDSCFAGDLIQATRSLPDTGNEEYFQRAYSRVCRQVLTSGATETVPAVSDFAFQLKSILKRNQKPYLDAFTLYNEVRLGVSSSVPLLGSLAGTGHQEGASFMLFLQPDQSAIPEQMAGPRPGVPAGTTTAARRSGFFSGALGGGAAFPVGGVAEAIQAAPFFWLRAHYNRPLGWGTAGIGLLAGITYLRSREDLLPYRYQILSMPVGVELRGQTPGDRPLCLSAAIAAGMAPCRIYFNDGEPQQATATKFFLAPSLGIGSQRFRHFRLIAEANYLLILFDENFYAGFSPGIRVEYAF